MRGSARDEASALARSWGVPERFTVQSTEVVVLSAETPRAATCAREAGREAGGERGVDGSACASTPPLNQSECWNMFTREPMKQDTTDRTTGVETRARSGRSSDGGGSRAAARLRGWGGGVVALAALGLAGCWEKTPRSMLEPVSSSGEISKWFWDMLIAVNSVIMAIVMIVFVAVVLKFRRKPGDDELPEQVHGNIKMEIFWTVIPALIVVGITVPTLQGIFQLEEPPPEGEKVIEIDVTGKQFWWEYDYINENFITASEMHVEVGTWVKLNVTSADVIHAFWVPRIMGKRDATPGRVYPMYFKVDKPGEYVGQCAELCGASHALMGIKVFAHAADGDDSYAAWVERQQKPAEEPTAPLAQKGKRLFVEKACVRCHNITGNAQAQISPMARSRSTGPDLTHVGSRTTIAGLALQNTKENLVKWIHAPGEVKEGSLMSLQELNGVPVSVEEAEALAAYLYRLK